MPEPSSARVRRWTLAGVLGAMATLHVVVPRPFVAMVPRWLPGERRHYNTAAAVAEGASALLLTSRRTARIGAWAAFGTFLGVFPANVEAVRRGGYRGAPGWLSTPSAAVARLPLQLPLLWWARRVARDAADPAA